MGEIYYIMQERDINNIVMLNNDDLSQDFNEVESDGSRVIKFKKKDKTVFANARLVDFENSSALVCDIVVEDGKILEIIPKSEDVDYKKRKKHCEDASKLYDCRFGFVIPPFQNSFCDSMKAFKNSYGLEIVDSETQKLVQNIMLVKNLMAGAVFTDFSLNECYKKHALLEDVEEKSEQELNELSDDVAKNKKRLFMKVGQTLDELGSLDKAYGKPLTHTLEDFGFLDRSYPVLVGGNCFEKDDFRFLKEHGVLNCVLCPSEDGRLGRRPTNVLQLKNLDFVVGLGSGYSFGVDFFAFMRQILLTQRGMFEDENCLTEKDVLLMAYSRVAICENPNDIFDYIQLRKGDSANFIVVRNVLEEDDLFCSDVLRELVWGKSKNDIELMVMHGKIWQQNNYCVLLNCAYEDLLKKLSEKLKEIKNEY